MTSEGQEFYKVYDYTTSWLESRDGGEVRLRSPGDFDIGSIENIDEKGEYVYYIASPKNPTQRYLFRWPIPIAATALS
ncbi:MAG: hypothetical protein ACREQ8_09430 [Woeseiaceae bacterium]